ncbi:MAG: FAD-dependent oxidoreductase [Magnetococcales bacterium]|nr:FAD-dependent oxidoreductase [Magnetococcales bacterium]
MNKSKLSLLLLIMVLVAAFFMLELERFFDLAYLKSQQTSLEAYRATNPIQMAAIFFGTYVTVTALSLPGATLMTLLGAAIFGLFWGFILISFASTIGATLAFLASRYLFRDAVQNRFGTKLSAFNNGIRKEGGFYLFTLRLVPIFPFFVINLAMGLTPIGVGAFYVISQIGMLPGTLVYVNAGTQLGQLESLSGILSPAMLGSFALLGIFPLLAKKVLESIQTNNALANYQKPAHFDRNLIVIGAGSAGLVTSYIAAAVKAKVTLIEKHRMGGDCLNTGCVPSKALIRSAKLLSQIGRASELGIKRATAEVDFAQVMERVQRVVQTVEPHDSVARYTQLGVECLQGTAKIISPWAVEVNGQTLTARNLVIATGARPAVPPIPGLDEMDYLTSDTIWDIREKPERLLVLGGGPIGSELAQAFSRLGCKVFQVQRGPLLMKREDVEISKMVMEKFRREGIEVLTDHTPKRFFKEGDEKILLCDQEGEEVRIAFDQVLVATGRTANVTGFGLEKLGVELRPNGTVAADPFMRTNIPTIMVCGDVTGPFQFTHTAAHQAWYASVNALFGPFKRFRVDYSVIPWCTFTDPEVARVGLNELEAGEQDIDYEVTTYGIDDLDRAIADEDAHGVVKILTVPGKDRILGVTIAGPHAGDLIAEFVLAMRYGIGLNKILGTIHIYPTLAEANKYAAGNWKKAHTPEKLLQWVRRFHAWRLGG